MEKQLSGEFILQNSGSEPKDNSSNLAQSKPSSSQTSSSPSSLHFYSSFCQYPPGLTFSEQEANEKILLLLRRHFITNFPWILASIILLFLPLFFPLLFNFSPIMLPSTKVVYLYIATYYLLIFGFVLLNFTLWYFQAGLVTQNRILDVNLSGILYRQISEAKTERIEDVTYSQAGFIRSLFNYGNVLVQTAGSEDNIEYDKVPKPAKVGDIIGDLSKAV